MILHPRAVDVAGVALPPGRPRQHAHHQHLAGGDALDLQGLDVVLRAERAQPRPVELGPEGALNNARLVGGQQLLQLPVQHGDTASPAMMNRWSRRDTCHIVRIGGLAAQGGGHATIRRLTGTQTFSRAPYSISPRPFLLSWGHSLLRVVSHTSVGLANAPLLPANAEVQPVWGLVVLSGLISGTVTGWLHHRLVRPTTASPLWWRLLMSAMITAAIQVLFLSQYW